MEAGLVRSLMRSEDNASCLCWREVKLGRYSPECKVGVHISGPRAEGPIAETFS